MAAYYNIGASGIFRYWSQPHNLLLGDKDMFTVSADFMGDFKLGDNINHNLEIITYFYQREDDLHDTDSWLVR